MDPVPEPEVARDEGAMMEPAVMPVQPVAEPVQPEVEVLETAAPGQPERSGVLASSAAHGEAGTSGQIAAGSRSGLGAGASGEGVSQAVVLRGVPKDFVRAEHEEGEVWQEQLELGGAINADLQCAVQSHWQE